MTRRILDRADYGRLVGTYLEPMIDHFPADADVLIVEDADGVIVGATSLFFRDHIEFTWIAESHRGHAGVARQLLQGIKATAIRRGTDRLLTASMDDLMTRLLAKLGAEPLPGVHYVWPLRKDS